MNTARSGRRDQNGLLVWKKFDKQLSETELRDELLSLENEGFQIVEIKNSKTIIVAVTSEGRAYSTSRLRKIGYSWERTVKTHNQLNSEARAKVQDLERSDSVARGIGVDSVGENQDAKN